MAVPGETACRPVAPCGDGTYGDIPTDGTTQHVDGSYPNNDSDGSVDKPWTTIQAAVDAAASGAIVAIADGSYAENVVVTGKPVVLWGRCPEAVEVVGADVTKTIEIDYGAEGTEVRNLAVRRGQSGIHVRVADVLLERVWVHDTEQGRAVSVTANEPEPGSAMLTVRGSLVEDNVGHGIVSFGGMLVVESSLVRTSRSGLSQGVGILMQFNQDSGARGELTLQGSLIEANEPAGIAVVGTDGRIDSTVVRGTGLDGEPLGIGINVEPHTMVVSRPMAEITRSVVVDTFASGIVFYDADGVVEHTVVRRTGVDVTLGAAGEAIAARPARHIDRDDPAPSVAVRQSVIAETEGVGFLVIAGDGTAESLLVQDTVPWAQEVAFGDGILIVADPLIGTRSTGSVLGSVVDRATTVGIQIWGATTTVEATRVSDTAMRDPGEFGQGIGVLGMNIPGLEPIRSNVTFRDLLVENNHMVGVVISVSDGDLERVVISNTQTEADGTFGDGLVSIAGANVTMRDCQVASSARVGLGSFSAVIDVATTELECNLIALSGEQLHDTPYTYNVGEGVRCGCNGEEAPCRVLSSGLAPPTYEPPSTEPR
jgi:hypothetical protein